MPKPTQAEVAALVDLAKRLRELPIPDCVRAADALEALMQERAEVHIDYPILASATQEAMGAAPPAKPAGKLPEIPLPVFWTACTEETPPEALFTAEQMRAYALRALRERA